jgi:hypothetical protein
MRYLVLIVKAKAAAGGFVVLKEALGEVGERFYSTLGFAAVIPAGPPIPHLECLRVRSVFR